MQKQAHSSTGWRLLLALPAVPLTSFASGIGRWLPGAAASSMSGVLDLTAAKDHAAIVEKLGPYADFRAAWEDNSALHLLAKHRDDARRIPFLITVGASDHWSRVNRTFDAELTDLGIQHTFEEREGGHDWNYWVSELANHAAWHAARLGTP